MPEKSLLNHYAGSKYEWLFIGTFWERLQTVEITDIKYFWNPPSIEHKMVKAFATIIHFTIQLIEIEKDHNILFCLHVYFDAHVPLMCALEDGTNIRSIFHKHQPKTENVLQ